jgi:hypothetical protein
MSSFQPTCLPVITFGSLILDSQIDARSNCNDELTLDQSGFYQAAAAMQAPGSHYAPAADSRLRWRIETDKMIQYEEMKSRGSERPASMFGGPSVGGDHRSATAQGVQPLGTNNSIMMSGTPTDVSNYYN